MLEFIDTVGVIANLDRVLDARSSYEPHSLANALVAILAPVCTLESFSRVPVTRMSHARDFGYDPRHDVHILCEAISIREHLRKRGVYVSRWGDVPPEQFLDLNFVDDPSDANIDNAVLSSLKALLASLPGVSADDDAKEPRISQSGG